MLLLVTHDVTFFSLGGYKSRDPNPRLDSADPETRGRKPGVMKSLFGVMESLLAQEEDEVFHRALDELEPVHCGGAAAAVDDEAGGAGPSRGRFNFRLDPFVD